MVDVLERSPSPVGFINGMLFCRFPIWKLHISPHERVCPLKHTIESHRGQNINQRKLTGVIFLDIAWRQHQETQACRDGQHQKRGDGESAVRVESKREHAKAYDHHTWDEIDEYPYQTKKQIVKPLLIGGGRLERNWPADTKRSQLQEYDKNRENKEHDNM